MIYYRVQLLALHVPAASSPTAIVETTEILSLQTTASAQAKYFLIASITWQRTMETGHIAICACVISMIRIQKEVGEIAWRTTFSIRATCPIMVAKLSSSKHGLSHFLAWLCLHSALPELVLCYYFEENTPELT
jgi:hypothetical protein